ncbi:hypothetical protein CfE428DRAFT_3955 [Chthoniobacter flavus Ellin428]|uniref:Uncharacterized protein n=1 Tax=Chthoniobacter flavus Ellin428 TaxID=497964 RepID=B4D4W7_9BACT|nr:hypothetical protein [Chthoniobacter flavus]EDY18570.1 hypothetical protein CfE428DRAFT_3955 [Chthoniobacter flavus Ellin428]TCO90975.1 hypothetical protein EV701_109125 [Chthoniobacter flavus]
MGYDLHIVRGADHYNNLAHQISSDEWLNYVSSDPELTLDPQNGSHFARWSGCSEHPEPWLDWFQGTIFSKNPDSAIINKMLSIAQQLDAQVRGDDGEIYTSPTEFHHDD